MNRNLLAVILSSAAFAALGPVGAAPATTTAPPPATLATVPAKSRAIDPLDRKVAALLAKMTLEEKVGQMVQWAHWAGKKRDMILEGTEKGHVGSLLNLIGAKETNEVQKVAVEKSRLGIPLIFGLDVIHGFKTIFPIPLGEDCSWDPELMEACAAVAAKEARASGIHWTFAPMVDVSREPRWGRIAEGSGEDPTLGSAMAAARVRGFQGGAKPALDRHDTVVACAKHYVGYGAPEAGREYNYTEITEASLRDIHLPPFKAALDAGVRTYMSAFNDLAGLPTSGNRHTLRDILRGEWGFKGFVVSDWASVAQLIPHGYAADLKDATQLGVLAGVDMDMEGKGYSEHLAQLAKENKVPLAMVNDAASRILKIKYELGLFEDPYVDEKMESATMLTAESLDVALRMAREAIVLLKNDKQTLPLSKDLKTIAVLGALAASKKDPLGSWHCQGKEADVVSVLEGLRRKLPRAQLNFVAGVGPEESVTDPKGIEEAVAAAKRSQVAIVVVGERENMSGEAASRTSLALPARQLDLVQAVHKAGVPVVLVLMNGRPLTIPWEAENVPAIVESWFLGTRQGDAVADVLFGDFNPTGKLVVTFPRNLGQVPIYHSARNSGRPAEDPNDKWTSRYIDSPNSPQYPFGYGLSYTTYTYSGLSLSAERIGRAGKVMVKATVKNTGSKAGVEVVQLYMQDPVASLTQPVKKLADFKRVELEAGEEKTVEFVLPASKLGFHNHAGKYVVEPGKFNVWVGKDSADATLKGSFELTAN